MSRKQALEKDPARLIACQEALAQFGRDALRTESLDRILMAACEQVARGLGVPMAKLAVVVPGGESMLLKAAVGIPESAGIPGVTIVPAGKGSAMGYALLTGGPVLSTVDTETRFAPSEVVRKSGVRSSANVVIWAGDEAFGALEADSPEPDVFDDHDIHFLELYANLVGAAVERQRLSSHAQALAAQRELLMKESLHRVKNILSVVQALAWRTRKESASLDDFIPTFSGRLNALSRLQDLTVSAGAQSLPLGDLARAEITATGAREGQQFVLNGPEFNCSPTVAQALGLLLYELATNSCKYGALRPEAPPNCRIELSWHVERRPHGTEVQLRWQESGVATKTSGQSTGFGSELLREGISRMLGGRTDLTVNDNGVECVTRFFQEE